MFVPSDATAKGMISIRDSGVIPKLASDMNTLDGKYSRIKIDDAVTKGKSIDGTPWSCATFQML